ncbi:MAG: hypothetical protein IIB66_07475, partial [Proteobacteria bacterium]|nr:hypothetical protein [Pseudomonadota bacterium]
MDRTGVNDAARERAAALKIFYDNPDMRRPFEDFDLARTSGLIFTITDRVGGIETNAGTRLEVGQRCRVELSNDIWEGFITIVNQVSDVCTVTIGIWDPADSEDVPGPVGAPDYFEVGPKELG